MNKMMVLLVLVVAVGAGAGGAFVVARSGGKGNAQAAAAQVPLQNLQLDERTVNLADSTGSHYLKLTVALELAGKGKAEKVGEEKTPQLMDCLIEIASKHTYTGLLSSEGKKNLKEELLQGFSKKMEGTGFEVKDVLFTDFVME